MSSNWGNHLKLSVFGESHGGGIGAVIILSLMAMVFRNLYLIIKRSETGTPFQPDNIRMLREIGIFAIAIPIVGLIMSIVCRLVLGVDAVETRDRKSVV